MGEIERIHPLLPAQEAGAYVRRVAEQNRDGRSRHHHPHAPEHDIIELHDEDAPPAPPPVEEAAPDAGTGLDIAI
jgi:hypothetical protein